MMTVCGAASTVTAQYTKALIRPQKRHNKIAMGTERSLPLKMKPAATEIKIDRPTATPTMMKGVASDTAHKTRLPKRSLSNSNFCDEFFFFLVFFCCSCCGGECCVRVVTASGVPASH
jgi:hypothetical protein